MVLSGGYTDVNEVPKANPEAADAEYQHKDPVKGEIISHETIEASIDSGEAYRIIKDGQRVGGVVIRVDGERGDPDLLFDPFLRHGGQILLPVVKTIAKRLFGG